MLFDAKEDRVHAVDPAQQDLKQQYRLARWQG